MRTCPAISRRPRPPPSCLRRRGCAPGPKPPPACRQGPHCGMSGDGCADTHAAQGRRVHTGTCPWVPPRAVRFLCINPHSTAASFRGKKTHEANRKENQPSVLTTADF